MRRVETARDVVFRRVNASVPRWVGRVLNLGELPPDGHTTLRAAVLRQVLGLDASASDAELEAELKRFKAHGGTRRY
jgi:hypothetical protein